MHPLECAVDTGLGLLLIDVHCLIVPVLIAFGMGVVGDVAAGNVLYGSVLLILLSLCNELPGLGLNAHGLPCSALHGSFRCLIDTNVALGQFPDTVGPLTYQHIAGGACMMLDQKRNLCHSMHLLP